MRSASSIRAVVVLAAAVAIASCSPESVETATTTTTVPPSTTTSPPTTTTTTLAPVAVEGAPAGLAGLVESFYDYAAGRVAGPPAAAEEIVTAITTTARSTPTVGIASVGRFRDQGVATVQMEADLFLAVDDGSGWRVVGGNWPSISVGPYYGSTPRLVAAIGSDARPGENITAKLADSIHVVGLDGAGGGGVVGIPRDSMVDSPTGGRRKITSVLASSGPEALTQTIAALSELPLEGYVITGFVGFQEMLGNVLGGVNITIPYAIKDRASGADLEAGEQYLNGPNALALARARKTLPDGDFNRSEHQGLIMLAAAKTVQSLGYGAVPRLLELSQPWLETNLTPEQLLTFSALLISSDLDNMVNTVAPGSTGWSGSASVVFLSDSAAELWVDLEDGKLEPQ